MPNVLQFADETASMKTHKKFIITSMYGSYIAELEILDRRPFTAADISPLDKINGFGPKGMPKWKYLVEIDDEYEPGGKERKWLSSHYRWKK